MTVPMILSAVAIAALAMAVGCSTPDLPSDQRKPDLVRVGMSPREVERYVGAPVASCWDYPDDQTVCFANNVVNVHSTFQPRNSKVNMGMSPREVAAIKGDPPAKRLIYLDDDGRWFGTFVGDRLTKFAYDPPPRLH